MAEATLDGRKTAFKEIHGLRIGDIIHYAITVEDHHAVPGMLAESWGYLNHSGVASRVYFRVAWPKDMKLRWKATEGFGEVASHEEGGIMELVSDRTNVETPRAPEGAPGRFNTLGELEVTEFKDWREVSRLFAPLYVTAAKLSPDSPIHAIVDRIRRENPTPEAQVAAALQVVEQDVRYLALAQGAAGFVPAVADDTWSRRFGDCKGKTTLLLALLTELGVKAVPALASTTNGDALPIRLPRADAFDHVILRAEVGGKVVWLDGTRTGDRALATLPAPGLKWVLPLTATGSGLEKIETPSPAQPTYEVTVTVDDSAGLVSNPTMTTEILARGDAGLALEQGYANRSRAEIERGAREASAKSDAFKFETIDYGYDTALGAMRVVIKGTTKGKWEVTTGGIRQTDVGGQIEPIFKARAPGPSSDAPFSLSFPSFVVATFKVRLPQGGKGFELIGSDVDRTVAGTAFKRVSKIADGMAVVTVTQRTLGPEVSYRDAMASNEIFKSLPTAQNVILRAPVTLAANTTSPKAVTKSAPAPGAATPEESAAILTRQADEKVKAKDHAAALALLDQAEKLDPKSGLALNERIEIYLTQKQYDDALRVARKGAEFFPGNEFWQFRPMMVLRAAGRWDDWLKAAELVIKNHKDWDDGYLLRAEALMHLGRVEEMLAVEDDRLAALQPRQSNRLELNFLAAEIERQTADARTKIDQDLAKKPESATAVMLRGLLVGKDPKASIEAFDGLIKQQPEMAAALSYRGLAYARQKDWTHALADYDRLVRFLPENGEVFMTRAGLYQKLGRLDDALLDLNEAVKLAPTNATALNDRCWFRATHNLDLDQALADCDEALRYSLNNPAYLDSRGLVNFRLKRYDQSITDYDAALAARPNQPDSLFGRGLARKAKGDAAEAESDFAAAVKGAPNVVEQFADYGLNR
jgi:tetratricopeptide (TPR) repeat protein